MRIRRNVKNFNDVNHNFHIFSHLLTGHLDDGNINDDAIATRHLQVGAAEDALTRDDSLGDLAWEDAVEKAMLGATIISGGYIVTGMISASRIDAGTIHADRIGVNSIAANKIDVVDLAAINANLGKVTAGEITSLTTINVGTDATIGRKLNLTSTNFGDGIFFGDIAEIYVDPAGSITMTAAPSLNGALTVGAGAEFNALATPLVVKGDVDIERDANIDRHANVTGNVYADRVEADHGKFETFQLTAGWTGSFDAADGYTYGVNNGVITGRTLT